MQLSIVIPVYQSEATIVNLVYRLFEAHTAQELEIVLVNDGSSDGSHAACLSLVEKYPGTIKYLNLAKNFGEHNAVMAGLNHVSGDYIVIIDDDFQNPPETVVKLVEKAVSESLDVVYSRYPKKQHSVFRNLGSRFTNLVAVMMLDKPHELYLSSYKCLSRFAVKEIIKYNGPFPYIDGLILRSTRKIGVVEIPHDKRTEGKSGYTLRKLLNLWLNMFINFSVLPLRLSSLLGFLFGLIGLMLAVEVALEKLFNPQLPVGWPFLVVAVMIFAGIQLLILGLLGEYIGRLFLTHNQTPQFVIRDIYPKN